MSPLKDVAQRISGLVERVTALELRASRTMSAERVATGVYAHPPATGGAGPTVTFPTPFKTVPNVVAQAVINSTSDRFTFDTINVTTTGFQLRAWRNGAAHTSGVTVNVAWIAVA